MITVLDVETTQTLDKRGNMNPSPHIPENRLVCVGYMLGENEPSCVWFHHQDRKPIEDGYKIIQEVLDMTELLVAHNVKFDLAWLRAAGFVYDGPIYDTMVAEYLIQRAMKAPLKLEALAEKYLDEERKATDLIEKYIKEGKTFDEIPAEVVQEYNLQDVVVTGLIREKQLEELKDG